MGGLCGGERGFDVILVLFILLVVIACACE
ncbi:YjcZ family sporulation protein [Aneurinibacillus tyrosinisolvens]|nr:YjcZ family sporulation protein [Aneurinibacillus tyrosinisolvens]